jgi:uncharacterized membrane protein
LAVPASPAVPSGPGFDIVLILHVASVLAGLATVVVSGVQAARLPGVAGRPGGPGGVADDLRRYYAPGVNWAGRVLYAVPVFGLALLAMSRGAYGLDDAWVEMGIGLWVLAAMGAEGLVWPPERRIQALLAAGDPDPAALGRAGRTVCAGAAGVAALLVLATVLMTARPG